MSKERKTMAQCDQTPEYDKRGKLQWNSVDTTKFIYIYCILMILVPFDSAYCDGSSIILMVLKLSKLLSIGP